MVGRWTVLFFLSICLALPGFIIAKNRGTVRIAANYAEIVVNLYVAQWSGDRPVLIIGDSRAHELPLSEMGIGFSVESLGIPGSTSRQWRHYADYIFPTLPAETIIVLWAGINDFIHEDRSAEEVLKDLTYIAHVASDTGLRMVLIDQIPVSVSERHLQLVIGRKLAIVNRGLDSLEKANPGAVAVIDLANTFQVGSTEELVANYYRDGVHLSDIGNQIVIDMLLRKIDVTRIR